ncbi:MAG: Mu-like prophage major head subunit gpT family protein, partial [Nitrospirae bacterium]|nr:Mu-like prophage major head subunit gpT family protein [Nitrospirota bacterium]
VPPSLEGEARALLMNDVTSTGATNTWKGTSELLVVSWLG